MPELENSFPEEPQNPPLAEETDSPENITPPQAGASFFAKLKTKWPIVLGALGSIAIFAALIYAAYSYVRRGQEVQPTPSPTAAITSFLTPVVSPVLSPVATPTLVPTLTPDDTEGWKKYTNEKYGFEIKYPADWIQSSTTDTGGSEYIKFRYQGIDDTNKANYAQLEILPRIQEVVSENLPTEESDIKQVPKGIIIMDGFSATRYSETSIMPNIELERVILKVDTVVYYFLLSINVNHPQKLEVTKQFDQILSTFKFLE